jgi:hypothetical protein
MAYAALISDGSLVQVYTGGNYVTVGGCRNFTPGGGDRKTLDKTVLSDTAPASAVGARNAITAEFDLYWNASDTAQAAVTTALINGSSLNIRIVLAGMSPLGVLTATAYVVNFPKPTLVWGEYMQSRISLTLDGDWTVA